MTEIDTAAVFAAHIDTAEIRSRHYRFRGWCIGCVREYGGYHDYPCVQVKFCDALDAARAQVDRLCKSLAKGQAEYDEALDEIDAVRAELADCRRGYDGRAS